jgi:hypothetical protein
MIKKKVIIFFLCFLFFQNQFNTLVDAAECENFGKEVDKNYEPIIPLEKKNDLGIYWSYKWDKDNQKIKVNRDKDKFPIIRFSLLEKKLIPGTIVKIFNDKDLSKIDDEDLLNLIANSSSAEIQFFNEKKVSKLEIVAKKYNYINFYLNDFVLNSINEVDPKEGFFSIDHKSIFVYKRPDLKEEGELLSDFHCGDHHIKTKKLFYPETWLTLVQFEKDQDKTSENKFFSNYDGLTWLEIISAGLVNIRSKFDFSNFPFDTQVLKIQYQTDMLVSGEGSDELEIFLISPEEEVFNNLNKYMNNNYLQEWKVSNTNVFSNFIETEKGYFDQLTLSITVQRNSNYYLFKIIIPVLLILSIAWCVLWIPTDEIESRLTTSIVSLLSLIAYNFVFQDDIPKLDILTSLDKFVLLSYLFCAIPIFTTIFLSRFVERNQKLASKRNQRIRIFGGAIYIFTTITIFYPTL